jgi:hypothetical protein
MAMGRRMICPDCFGSNVFCEACGGSGVAYCCEGEDVDMQLLPPVTFDDLPKFEDLGNGKFIRREKMTRAEFERRYSVTEAPFDWEALQRLRKSSAY